MCDDINNFDNNYGINNNSDNINNDSAHDNYTNIIIVHDKSKNINNYKIMITIVSLITMMMIKM